MVAGLAPLRPPLHLSVTRAAVVVESKWWFDRAEPSRSCIQDTHPFYGSEGAIAGRGASVPRFPVVRQFEFLQGKANSSAFPTIIDAS
jgi:hypothetical protein